VQIERVEEVDVLAGQAVPDVERDQVDEAGILAIVPEHLHDVHCGLLEGETSMQDDGGNGGGIAMIMGGGAKVITDAVT
jgi:hypothetical protein